MVYWQLEEFVEQIQKEVEKAASEDGSDSGVTVDGEQGDGDAPALLSKTFVKLIQKQLGTMKYATKSHMCRLG